MQMYKACSFILFIYISFVFGCPSKSSDVKQQSAVDNKQQYDNGNDDELREVVDTSESSYVEKEVTIDSQRDIGQEIYVESRKDVDAEESHHGKQRPALGAKHRFDKDEDVEFRKVVDAAVKSLNKPGECLRADLVSVDQATKQIVSGIKYEWTMTINIAHSKEDPQSCVCGEFCDASSNQYTVIGEAHVQPWKKSEKIKLSGLCEYASPALRHMHQVMNCQSSSKPNQPAKSGLQSKVQMTAEDFKASEFDEAVQKVIEELNDKDECVDYKLINIKSGTKQNVSGTLYSWTMEVQPIRSEECSSDCESQACDVPKNQIVKAEVKRQPWLNNLKIISLE